MEITFTPEQEALIHYAIASGRYRSADDAVRDAMARWEEAERIRWETLAGLDEAEADLKAGRFMDFTDSDLPRLAENLKHEAREARERS